MRKLPRLPVNRIFPVVVLFFTMFLCLVVRISSIDSIPSNITADEGDTLRTYIYLKQQPFSLYALNWNGSSSLNTYIVGSLWTLGGESFASIKYASAIISMIALLLFYLIILKVSQNAFLASLATAALSTNAAFLNFSRSGWENIFTSVPMLLLVYILHHQTFPLKPKYLAMFILSLVISLYVYHPGKIVFLVSFVWFFVALIRSKATIYHKLRDLILVCVIVCTLSFPIIYATLSPTTNGVSRINNVSIFNTSNPSKEFVQNLVVNTKALFLWENNNLRYSAGGFVLNPLILALYLMSFALALVFNRKVFLFFILNFLIIQTLSTRTPDVARTVHLIPLIYYLIIMMVIHLERRISHAKNVIKVAFKVYYIIVLVSLAFTTIYDMQRYLVFATNSETIEARRPAVKMEDYALWLGTTKRDPLGTNLYSWEDFIEKRNRSR